MNEIRRIWESIYAQQTAMLEGLEKVKGQRAELLKLFEDMATAPRKREHSPEFLKEIDEAEAKCLAWEEKYYTLLEDLK